MSSEVEVCNMARILADDLATKYASKCNVDDFDTFRFLVYLHQNRFTENRQVGGTYQ